MSLTDQDMDWLAEENRNLESTKVFESVPYMKFEENKVIEIEIDFTKPFERYKKNNDKGQEITKVIIPVKHAGEKKNWWLNLRNPIYRDVIHLGASGQNKMKILQTGQQQNTKYVVVK